MLFKIEYTTQKNSPMGRRTEKKTWLLSSNVMFSCADMSNTRWIIGTIHSHWYIKIAFKRSIKQETDISYRFAVGLQHYATRTIWSTLDGFCCGLKKKNLSTVTDQRTGVLSKKHLGLDLDKIIKLTSSTSGWSVSWTSCFSAQFGCFSKSLKRMFTNSCLSLRIRFASNPFDGVSFFLSCQSIICKGMTTFRHIKWSEIFCDRNIWI